MIHSEHMDLREVKEQLNEGMKSKLVSDVHRRFNDVEIMQLVFERYYFRNGSFANLTVLFIQTDTILQAEIIASGGGNGLLNMSHGANEDFKTKAESILYNMGFRY